MTSLLTLSLVLSLLLLLGASWGPGTHLEFAERVYRRRRTALPKATAALIERERRAFLYGNIAADIINFKSYGGHYNHCHRWTIVEEMRRHALHDAEHAFALGYLAHLAADTIAHNHFVPYHLARYARTKGLGHLYWEMSADRFVPHERWTIVTELKADKRLEALDEIVNRCVPRKALSMRTNKFLFNHVLLVSERERWRHGMARLHPLGDVQLKKGFLALFQVAAVERIRLALHPKGLREIQRVDANGKEAQASAMRMRAGLLERWTSPKERWQDAEPRAAAFLLGMESPPRR